MILSVPVNWTKSQPVCRCIRTEVMSLSHFRALQSTKKIMIASSAKYNHPFLLDCWKVWNVVKKLSLPWSQPCLITQVTMIHSKMRSCRHFCPTTTHRRTSMLVVSLNHWWRLKIGTKTAPPWSKYLERVPKAEVPTLTALLNVSPEFFFSLSSHYVPLILLLTCIYDIVRLVV